MAGWQMDVTGRVIQTNADKRDESHWIFNQVAEEYNQRALKAQAKAK